MAANLPDSGGFEGSQCRSANRTASASTAPPNSSAAMKYIPFAVDPVASLISPEQPLPPG
jgi:hypothetical protein